MISQISSPKGNKLKDLLRFIIYTRVNFESDFDIARDFWMMKSMTVTREARSRPVKFDVLTTDYLLRRDSTRIIWKSQSYNCVIGAMNRQSIELEHELECENWVEHYIVSTEWRRRTGMVFFSLLSLYISLGFITLTISLSCNTLTAPQCYSPGSRYSGDSSHLEFYTSLRFLHCFVSWL